MAAAGITAGLAVALWLTRQVQSQLFGLAPNDPATLAAAPVSARVRRDCGRLRPGATGDDDRSARQSEK